MEKNTDKETQDFMNVNSFSQLPFIRPAPVKEKGGIRLFGIEFSQKQDDSQPEEYDSGETTEESTKETTGESGRKFECHYCCRNFPTSQALGGHQNAHKRERQHAKRAHLQSALAHGTLSDPTAHVYRLAAGSVPSPTFKLGRGFEPSPYPPWHQPHPHNHHHNNGSSVTLNGHRFYGSSFEPINGNPLPGLWRIPIVQNRIPTFNRDRFSSSSSSSSSIPLPLLAGEESRPGRVGSSSQNLHVYESTANVHDHVSLDLHL
ncbi:zinc finger protein GIS2-like [Tasmannia lanceolata]|uniref:zinc finger protein GIS2-like n=1 Tax=Tasmannia lanceolata TaxID=3420 RepID=UPI0040646104